MRSDVTEVLHHHSAMHRCLKVTDLWHELPFNRVASADFADDARVALWRTSGWRLRSSYRRYCCKTVRYLTKHFTLALEGNQTLQCLNWPPCRYLSFPLFAFACEWGECALATNARCSSNTDPNTIQKGLLSLPPPQHLISLLHSRLRSQQHRGLHAGSRTVGHSRPAVDHQHFARVHAECAL